MGAQLNQRILLISHDLRDGYTTSPQNASLNIDRGLTLLLERP